MTTPTASLPYAQKPAASVLTRDAKNPNAVDPIAFRAEQELRKFKHFKNSKQGKDVRDWCDKEYSRMKSRLQSMKQQWYINLAMYYGNQYTDRIYDRSGGFLKIGVPNIAKHRARAVTNFIRPMIRTEISRMSSQKPTISVMPASSETSDMMAANAAEMMWESLYYSKNFKALAWRNAFWTTVLGTSFIKTTWDSSYVDPIVGFQGDVNFEVVTPFNLLVPELLIEDIEDQPWVFHVTTRPLTWVKKFFGERFDDPNKVSPNCVNATEIIDESRFLLPSSAQAAKPDAVLIIEGYIKPGYNELCPNGAFFTIAGDELVSYEEGLPYSHNQYPFAKSIHIPTGKFYGDSVLIDIIPLQREYNRTTSQLIDSKNRTARPQLLVATGSMDATRYTSEPGLIINYTMGFPKPEPMPLVDIPSYVIQQQQEARSAMEDISGQHQVTRGQAPGGGVQAATAISFLQEKDDSLMAATFASLEQQIEKIGRQSLNLCVEFMETGRMIRIVGMDGAFDTQELKGSDLTGAVDLRVEGGSALPESKPAKQAFLMDLADKGFITPDKLLELLDFGGVENLNRELNTDKNEAQRENIRMRDITQEMFVQHTQEQHQIAAQGAEGATDPNTGFQTVDPGNPEEFAPLVPVHDYQNHAVHIATHNTYRKSQEFEVLPEWVKIEFDKHVKAHMMQYEMQQMGQAFAPPGSQAPPDPTLNQMQQQVGDIPGMPPTDMQGPGPEMAQPPVNTDPNAAMAPGGGQNASG